jgi:predicted membrane protein
MNGLIGDFGVEVPADTPVKVNVSGFVVDTKIFDQKKNNILTPLHYQSEGYEAAERKLRFEITHLIGDVKVKQA